jgi:hypothetical protein
MLAVIVAVLLLPLLSVSLNVPGVVDAPLRIVTGAVATVDPEPVVTCVTVIVLPVGLFTVLWFASISLTLAWKVPLLPALVAVHVTAVMVV